MNLIHLKQLIKDAILIGHIQKALELFTKNVHENSEYYAPLARLESDYNHMENNRDLLSTEDRQLIRNKTVDRLLHYLGQIKEEDILKEEDANAVSSKPKINTTFDYRREMILPYSILEGLNKNDKGQFIIATSPLAFRKAVRQSKGYNRFFGTTSDYVGVKEILQTLGSYNYNDQTELLDPDDYVDDVYFSTQMNLYCIASPKANRWTGLILDDLNNRWKPGFLFLPDPENTDLRNIQVALYKTDEKEKLKYSPEFWGNEIDDDRKYKDYGIIIRAPHPRNSQFMVTVLAGRSSLGTEAVCHAFTSQEHTQKIQAQLKAFDDKFTLADHRQAFSVLVSMSRHRESHTNHLEPILESLKIEECRILVAK